MRWYLALQPFTFTIQHQASKEHANIDTLSWLRERDMASPQDQELDFRGYIKGAWPASETDKEGWSSTPSGWSQECHIHHARSRRAGQELEV